MNIVRHLIDVVKGKHPLSAKRSNQWPSIRAKHLLMHPTCEVCGSTEKLEVHHKKPFHLEPELELDLSNLVTLCESKRGGVNCHLWFGHLGNFKSFNVNVLKDAAEWLIKLTTRPKG